mgnify:FL=1
MMGIIKFIFIALMSCVLLTSCNQNIGTTWQEQYDLGTRYLSEGNYEEAIIAFSGAIEIDPKRAEAYVGLADAYVGTGEYMMALEWINQARKEFGDLTALNRLVSNIDFLRSEESGIKITNLYFDQNDYLMGEETDFLVSVAYSCPIDEPCVLMIGANTEEANAFAMLDEDYEVTGKGGYQFSVTLEPIHWDESDFGIYVNLSEADHEETWSPSSDDILYISDDGTISEDVQENVISSKPTDSDQTEEIRDGHIDETGSFENSSESDPLNNTPSNIIFLNFQISD